MHTNHPIENHPSDAYKKRKNPENKRMRPA
jgi:hypothetical protein